MNKPTHSAAYQRQSRARPVSLFERVFRAWCWIGLAYLAAQILRSLIS